MTACSIVMSSSPIKMTNVALIFSRMRLPWRMHCHYCLPTIHSTQRTHPLYYGAFGPQNASNAPIGREWVDSTRVICVHILIFNLFVANSIDIFIFVIRSHSSRARSHCQFFDGFSISVGVSCVSCFGWRTARAIEHIHISQSTISGLPVFRTHRIAHAARLVFVFGAHFFFISLHFFRFFLIDDCIICNKFICLFRKWVHEDNCRPNKLHTSVCDAFNLRIANVRLNDVNRFERKWSKICCWGFMLRRRRRRRWCGDVLRCEIEFNWDRTTIRFAIKVKITNFATTTVGRSSTEINKKKIDDNLWP